MGGMGGGMGGYNGPQAGGPNMGNFAPTQPTGLGYANTMMDPASMQRCESGGYAPTSGYTGRSEREINPAAKYRTNEVGMTRGEAAPVYNNYNAGYNPGTQPAVAHMAQQLESIPPVNNAVASGTLPASFANALRPATPAEAARYEEPETPPMTPGQIQNALNPLSGAGY
jgi:hypothetical protein